MGCCFFSWSDPMPVCPVSREGEETQAEGEREEEGQRAGQES